MSKHITIHNDQFQITEQDLKFTYQAELTKKLDVLEEHFNQEVINEIVLWKVNRYAHLDEGVLELLNKISKDSKVIDIALTKILLTNLLKTKGIQLPMASTILRFKNPSIYQIIDQRVYRLLYDHEYKVNTYPSLNNLSHQVELYLDYLSDLRVACSELSIRFEDADRVLFMADKRINSKHKLKNY